MEIYLKSFRLIKSLSNKPYITLYYTEGKKITGTFLLDGRLVLTCKNDHPYFTLHSTHAETEDDFKVKVLLLRRNSHFA